MLGYCELQISVAAICADSANMRENQEVAKIFKKREDKKDKERKKEKENEKNLREGWEQDTEGNPELRKKARNRTGRKK